MFRKIIDKIRIFLFGKTFKEECYDEHMERIEKVKLYLPEGLIIDKWHSNCYYYPEFVFIKNIKNGKRTMARIEKEDIENDERLQAVMPYIIEKVCYEVSYHIL